jgi:TPR repeat protein
MLTITLFANVNHYDEGIKYLEENKIENAINCFKTSSDLGNAKAMLKLGLLKEHYENNLTQAVDWYKKAKSAGNLKALYHLGRLSCEQETYTYLSDFEDFAKDNKKSVQYDLAVCFEKKGEMNKAKKWFKIVANKGDVIAQYRLAMLFDKENKLFWLKKSAQNGYVPAQFDLGKLLFKQQKTKEAKIWLEKAKNNGSKKAAIYLKRMKALGL